MVHHTEGETMEIGVGLDERLRLSYPESREAVRQAAALGFTSAWTPGGVTSRDAFHTCVQWSQSAERPISTGISVVPAPVWTPASLASQAATAGELTEGRFILGIGTGGVYGEEFRGKFDLPNRPVVALMRDYLTILRGLLAGEEVSYAGKALALRGVKLGFKPRRVPLYLASMGPQMLHLAGQLADGALPNWSSPELIAWCRERLVEGAQRVGRDPSEVRLVQYIRVCVDEDVDAARRALGEQILGYALARPGASRDTGYRAHFTRMGFDEVLTDLEARREKGTPVAELLGLLPDHLMLKVGYFGRPEGAAQAVRRLAEGLDAAVVRVITTQPGLERVMRTIDACRPDLVRVA